MRDDLWHEASDIDAAVLLAETAFKTYGRTSGTTRAAFLRQIAEDLEGAERAIVDIAMEETALPEARLTGELARTTAQLRMFADLVAAPSFPETVHVPADPTRTPLPRPDLRLVHRPVGPVAIFGASNFPLAFSVAGGDTASALATGCTVVFKGHPAHPGTGRLVASIITEAARALGLPDGVFALLQGDGIELGRDLVRHPLITAVGFTGSLKAGRALFDLCAARPVPIPFFGELGSINPVFVMPRALAARGPEIADGWIASLTLGVGQFCTNPGLLILPDGAEAEAFIDRCVEAAGKVAPQPMLTDGMAANYRAGVARAQNPRNASTVFDGQGSDRQAGPVLLRLSGSDWIAQPDAQEEVFGPCGLLVTSPEEQFSRLAEALSGQLTATLFFEPPEPVDDLVAILERKAGRLVANGYPTGVEVSPAMVHGGPFPASTNFGATAVGATAVHRWLRAVCYQDFAQG